MEIIGALPETFGWIHVGGFFLFAVGAALLLSVAVYGDLDAVVTGIIVSLLGVGSALFVPGVVQEKKAEQEFVQQQVAALEDHYGVPVDADVVDRALSNARLDSSDTSIREFSKVVDGKPEDMGIRVVDNHIFVYEKNTNQDDFTALEPVK